MIDPSSDKAACAVAEAMLQNTAAALMADDFRAFIALFRLPHTITTHQSRIEVTEPDQMQRAFDETSAFFRASGVTELRRDCLAAEFRGPDKVEFTHMSHVVAGDVLVRPPYPVFSVVERENGVWRLTAVDYDLGDETEQGRALRAAGRADNRAQVIYQSHLDVLTKALMDKDVVAFQGRISLPLQITTQTDHIEIATPAALTAAFWEISAIFGQDGVTEFVRIVTEAAFVSDTEIVGVHESHQMRHGNRIVQPYPNRLRLVLDDDGIWRETHCANALLNHSADYKHWSRVAENPQLPDLKIDPERTLT